SDIDDTAMVTAVPRPLIAAWNTFVRHSSARVPVPGMAALYRGIATERPGTPFVYVSTGAWNTAANLRRFLQRHGFPPGPLLLTDWGPTNTGWFRSGPEHKDTALERLFRELPDVDWLLIGDDGQHAPAFPPGPRRLRDGGPTGAGWFRSGPEHKDPALERLFRELPDVDWLLIGDDGQHDPEIYARAARRFPDHVAAVAIRELTPAQQVLAHGSPLPAPGSLPGEVGTGVPTAFGPDGDALTRALARALRR